MAAMGLVSLKYLDRDNSYRRQLAEWYQQQLADDDLIRVIPVLKKLRIITTFVSSLH